MNQHEVLKTLFDPEGDLGIHQEIIDFNDEVRRLPNPPRFVNDIDTSTIEGKEELNHFLVTKYDKDYITNTPMCECGSLADGVYTGATCTRCGTKVLPLTERPLYPSIWLRVPDGVAGFINPTVWLMLSNAFTASGCNLIEWLVNPGYRGNFDSNKYLNRLKTFGFPQGLNNFIKNFDAIMEALLSPQVGKMSVKARENLRLFIKENRHKIFCQYLPIPNKITFAAERSDVGDYTDYAIAGALEAVRTISSLSSFVIPLSQSKREQRTVKAVSQLASYVLKQFGDTLAGKPGLLRKQVYGTRMAFAYRSVISSRWGVHKYDEIELPWGLGVSVHRVELGNKLKRLGYGANEATKLINSSVKRHNPVIDGLLDELLAEGGGRLSNLFGRNPTLARLSIQNLYVRDFKRNVKDNTTSLSVLVLKGPNADFDGDCMNGVRALDKAMAKSFRRLEPHLGLLDLETPRTVSSDVALPAPTVMGFANWFEEGRLITGLSMSDR